MMIALLRRQVSLLVIGTIALIAAVLVWRQQGMAGLARALRESVELFVFTTPALIAGLFLAAVLRQVIAPRGLGPWLGAGSGWRGLALATAAGVLTPGGPMAAFPMVLVLAAAGADRGAVVAFILSWALNGCQKLLIYELPLLGAEFALLRTLLTLPLPLLAGAIARRLPWRWDPPR